MTEGRFHHLEGQAKPLDDTWAHHLDAVTYFTPPTEPDRNRLLAGLGDDPDALRITDLTYRRFQNRLADDVALLSALGSWQHPHPWINLFLPDHAAEHVVHETLGNTTAQDIGESGVVLLYPVPRARITTPRFRLPDAPTAFLFALLRAAPPDDTTTLTTMPAANQELQQQVVALGGTAYVGDIET